MSTQYKLAVIEDTAANRVLIRRALSGFDDWDVHEAGDGIAGLELIRSLKPDLVLLDLRLPGMEGKDVLQALRADDALADTLVAVFSASVGAELMQAMFDAGCWRFLTKPLDLNELRATVREAQGLRTAS